MAKKIDGVIDAVRYKNGQIVLARAYLRRGFTFSDWMLLDRKTLVSKLKKGEHLVVGSREEFKASTFVTGKKLLLVNNGERELIATYDAATQDDLEDAPLF